MIGHGLINNMTRGRMMKINQSIIAICLMFDLTGLSSTVHANEVDKRILGIPVSVTAGPEATADDLFKLANQQVLIMAKTECAGLNKGFKVASGHHMHTDIEFVAPPSGADSSDETGGNERASHKRLTSFATAIVECEGDSSIEPNAGVTSASFAVLGVARNYYNDSLVIEATRGAGCGTMSYYVLTQDKACEPGSSQCLLTLDFKTDNTCEMAKIESVVLDYSLITESLGQPMSLRIQNKRGDVIR